MSQALSDEENPKKPSCYGIERYSFSYNEIAGLDRFDVGFKGFIDDLHMNWNKIKLNGTIISEIMVSFVGMRFLLITEKAPLYVKFQIIKHFPI